MFQVNWSYLFKAVAWGTAIAALAIGRSPDIARAEGVLWQPSTTWPERVAVEPEVNRAPYTLGVGDRIGIEIFDLPEFSDDYQIPVGGTLNLPLIGQVNLVGLTLAESSEVLRDRYLSVLKDPIITVTLITPRPLNVSILGEVRRPGSYAIELTQVGLGNQVTNQYPTLTQAIEQAGGITLAADLSRVQVRRDDQGGDRIIKIDLEKFLQGERRGQALQVRDGDTIFVPTTTTVDLAKMQQFGTVNFAADVDIPRTVAVVGEVHQPGVYVVIGGDTTVERTDGGLPTVSRAIQIAGGITPEADIRHVYIRRLTQSGTEQIVPVNLWQFLQAGNFNLNPLVQTGDTIVVPTVDAVNPAEVAQLTQTNLSPETIQVFVVGEVNNEPGTVQGILDLPAHMTLNQALLAAGGFNESRANRKSIQLIRLNDDGTVLQRRISVDFSRGIDEETNPILRDNDTIVVDRSLSAKISDALRTPIRFAPEAAALVGVLVNLGVIGNN